MVIAFRESIKDALCNKTQGWSELIGRGAQTWSLKFIVIFKAMHEVICTPFQAYMALKLKYKIFLPSHIWHNMQLDEHLVRGNVHRLFIVIPVVNSLSGVRMLPLHAHLNY